MQSDLTEIKSELKKQEALLESNNKLLRQIRRYQTTTFWFTVIWYAVLIGLPFALYYYLLEPYFSAFGSSYETFNAGIQEIPGLKQFEEILRQYQEAEGTNVN